MAFWEASKAVEPTWAREGLGTYGGGGKGPSGAGVSDVAAHLPLETLF